MIVAVLLVELLFDCGNGEFCYFVAVVVDVLDYLDQSGQLFLEAFQTEFFLQDLCFFRAAMGSESL